MAARGCLEKLGQYYGVTTPRVGVDRFPGQNAIYISFSGTMEKFSNGIKPEPEPDERVSAMSSRARRAKIVSSTAH